MKSIKDYILEALRFKMSKDEDYFYRHFDIITFIKDEHSQYKKEGKTAGVSSHALKHMGEFNPNYVKTFVQKVKREMRVYHTRVKHPRNYQVRLYSTLRSFDTKDPLKLIDIAPEEAVLNFLDLVNDRRILKEPQTDIGLRMYPLIDEITDEYEKMLEKILHSSVSLDEITSLETMIDVIKSNDTVTFTSINDRNEKLFFTIDFKKSALIIQIPNEITTTGYVMNRKNQSAPTNKVEILLLFAEKMFKKTISKNPLVYQAISKITKINIF